MEAPKCRQMSVLGRGAVGSTRGARRPGEGRLVSSSPKGASATLGLPPGARVHLPLLHHTQHEPPGQGQQWPASGAPDCIWKAAAPRQRWPGLQVPNAEARGRKACPFQDPGAPAWPTHPAAHSSRLRFRVCRECRVLSTSTSSGVSRQGSEPSPGSRAP